MATNTENDLILQVMRVLGVLEAGQNPSAEDVVAVQFYVQPTFDQLSDREIVTIDDNDEIPSSWLLPLAVLVADAASQEFGLAGVPTDENNPNPVVAAENKLREIAYSRPSFVPQRSDYF